MVTLPHVQPGEDDAIMEFVHKPSGSGDENDPVPTTVLDEFS